MSNVVVFGATGYAGSAIVDELVGRGHVVTAVSRTGPPARPGVPVRAGSAADAGFVAEVSAGAEVLVAALPALDEQGGGMDVPVAVLVEAARTSGARLGVVGGAGSLRVGEGGPRLVETPEFPEFLVPVVAAHAKALEVLHGSDDAVDWFYLSPAASYGPHNPGERTGSYRVGGLVLLTDAQGNSEVSGPDYAIAFVDELDKPAHHREQFTVGY